MNLLKTTVGYNAHDNPWDTDILEIDPLTGHEKWIFKIKNGKLALNHIKRYGCIEKLLILA